MMKIGLGLPNAVPDIPDGRFLLSLATQAEQAGFSSVGTIGRVAYPNYEELVTLSAVAGATQRIGLFTDILLGPTREPVDYYGGYGERLWAAAVKDAESARAPAREFEAAGCDELFFFAEAPGPEQVERLAEAVL